MPTFPVPSQEQCDVPHEKPIMEVTLDRLDDLIDDLTIVQNRLSFVCYKFNGSKDLTSGETSALSSNEGYVAQLENKIAECRRVLSSITEHIEKLERL